LDDGILNELSCQESWLEADTVILHHVLASISWISI
jgi:hypothetical protein